MITHFSINLDKLSKLKADDDGWPNKLTISLLQQMRNC